MLRVMVQPYMIVFLYILEIDFTQYCCKKIIFLYSYLTMCIHQALLIADKSNFKKMVMTGPDISHQIELTPPVCFSRGLVLGLWSACASVGNIIGAFLVSGVLDYGYDVSHMTLNLIQYTTYNQQQNKNTTFYVKPDKS